MGTERYCNVDFLFWLSSKYLKTKTIHSSYERYKVLSKNCHFFCRNQCKIYIDVKSLGITKLIKLINAKLKSIDK